MRLGWKIFIPITLVWLVVIAVWMQTPCNIWTTAGRMADHGAQSREFFAAVLLLRTFKGLALTGRYLFARKITVLYPGGEDAAVAAFPRPACAAPLRERRGALHRLQAVRGGVPGAWRSPSNPSARRRLAPHHALRHRPDQVHLLRLLRGELPGRLDRRDPHARIPRRTARRPVLTKEMLLAVGDRYEAQIAARRAAARRDSSPVTGRPWTSRRPSLFYCFRRDPAGRGAARHHRAQSGARGAVPGAGVLLRRLPVDAAAGRVSRHRAGAGLRRCGDGAVPVRGDDARHPHRPAARGLLAPPAARRARSAWRSRCEMGLVLATATGIGRRRPEPAATVGSATPGAGRADLHRVPAAVADWPA